MTSQTALDTGPAGSTSEAGTALGRNFYVDQLIGSDSNPGTEAEPFQSVKHALTVLQHGDTLHLNTNATYPDTAFPATLRGTAESPITITSYGGEQAVFDGGVPELARVDNDAWEPVPGGHPDEWRTKQSYQAPSGNREPFRFGQILASKYRLLTYSVIDDLRATNESFAGRGVKLSDLRPAGGPLVDDPTRKIPWAYYGPGVYWVFDDSDPASTNPAGRIHVRLSHTHLDAPGIRDYDGPTDPNQVALSIAREDLLVARIGAQHVIFKNLTFQNGGEATVQVRGQHLTFDHCRVYASRFGLRISAEADHLSFRHCTFDGGLAPWTTRADVKSSYEYFSAYFGPGDPRNEVSTNHLANKTSDMLIIHYSAHTEFAYCTFQHGHDAIRIAARDVSIHHCLFEDLNDETVQFDENTADPNIRVHENLFRQVLQPFSFALDQPGGPLFIYRNVIDQRVPTRGYRILPPDAPAPFVWRYGASFKMGNPVPAFHYYQNTILSSHPDDKASALTLAFAAAPEAPAPARSYFNNLHVGLNLDLPFSWVVPNDATRTSDGNLWYEPHRSQAPLFRLQDNTGIDSLAELAQIDPRWESHSTIADPAFMNFTDEYFDHQVAYPNNDLRLTPGSPGVMTGIVLPADLPDPLRPQGGAHPDVGALGSAPLAVGVDAATVLPMPGVPQAHAGADQDVTDTDNDGFESVIIDGSQSSDPGDSLLQYRWTLDGQTVATAATGTLYLPEGEHYLRLHVENTDGHSDTDATRIRIRPPTHHGENLLLSPGFEDSATGWHIEQASFALPGDMHSGLQAIQMDAISQQPVVTQRVPVSPGVTYTVSAWIRRTTNHPTATIRAVFLDEAGDTLEVADMIHTTPVPTYVYRQETVLAPPNAATMELRLGHALQGRVLFDDVRVLDRNLLVNPGFETRAPSGQEDAAPGWRFERGGLVIDEPANVRGRSHALALVGAATFRQVTQTVPIVGGRPYRISGWVKRDTVLPEFRFQFDGAGQGRVPLDPTPQGIYTHVSHQVTAPTTSTELTVRLRLPPGVSGTSYFDDLMVEEATP